MASPKTKGRMIKKDISDSKGYAALSPEAAVLFAMMIPHYTPHGKLNGDPGYIKGEICPRIPYLTTKNIPKCLREITEHTSVKWFENDGRAWIHSLNFNIEHQDINLERVGPDSIPNYSGVNPELVRSDSGVTQPLSLREVEVEGEGTERSAPAPAAGVSDEDYIRQVKDHYNAMIDDPARTQEWRNFYNGAMEIDALLFAACTWLVENPRRRRSDLKKFYGNWLRKEFQERARKEERSV